METMRVNTPRRRTGNRRLGRLVLLAGIAAVAAGAFIGWQRWFMPNNERVEPVFNHANPLIHRDIVLDSGALVDGESIKLPLEAVTELLGSQEPIRYEEETESIILTTEDKVVHLRTDGLTATVNQKPFDLSFAAEKKDGELYLPLAPLEQLFGVQAEHHADTSIVTIRMPGDSVQRAAAAREEAMIRTEPTIKAPIVASIMSGEDVRIWGEQANWYRVEGPAGIIGYMAKTDAVLTDIETVPEPSREQPFIAWKVYGQKINLTWEAVYSRNPDVTKIGELPGVNVVSPTWFELQDPSGRIRSQADTGYVSWAHKNGFQVWALFSNSFDPDLTTAALSNYESRLNMIKQLLTLAQMYKLQGINIDFENVYTKDKDNLVQFVREMTPLLHEQGLVVSIDVTPKSSSEMWSAFLDRKALGQTVDYMMVMTYDEHWASSPKSGSVASLPWVERSVVRILEEDGVPPQKLVLGVPLYTRIWTETKGDDGKVKVTSKAVGMEAVEKLLKEKKLEPDFHSETGQNYVEYSEEGVLQRIWLEDETSIEARLQLVKKYDLAGIATWQRAFHKPSIWDLMDEVLHKRP
ncbi:glycosyl hydrolase family 18 protein [Paenibacillus tarimensis]